MLKCLKSAKFEIEKAYHLKKLDLVIDNEIKKKLQHFNYYQGNFLVWSCIAMEIYCMVLPWPL